MTDLSALFRPRRIAVIGASDKSYFSRNLVGNLVDAGFGDRLHLVNKRNPTVHNLPAVPSVADIGAEIDLAFTMVPQDVTLDALAEAAEAGARHAVVLTSGYAEAGPDGREAQRALVAQARSLGVTVLGPNMLGYANFVDAIPATTILNLPRHAGPVALLSQSGASSSAMLEFASAAGVGLSYLVTLGNEAMVTAGHVLDFMVSDETTRAIAMFVESVRDPEVFRAAAARALDAGKAVVVLKAGRSELAARTAAAHTGALVGDDATVAAVFRDLGIIRVDTIEDLLVTAGAAAQLGRLRTSGVGVVSISGGACDIIADLAEDVGMPLPSISAATVDALEQVMPAFGSVQNPLDVTGAAVTDPTLNTSCIEAMGNDPDVGVVMGVYRIPWQAHEEPFPGQVFIDAIGKGAASSAAPVVLVNQVMQPITATTRAVLERGGVPYAICGLSQAVTALRHVGWWSAQLRARDERPPRPERPIPLPEPADRTGHWSEARARDLLTGAGVPVVPSAHVHDAEQAADAAERFAAPVAVKLVSPQIVHKSDIGGVRLGVIGAAGARAAFREVTEAGHAVPGAHVDGALVSPMRTGGIELLVGVVRDPLWGPILAVALGGVLVEVLHDAQLAPLPVEQTRVREMLMSLRGAAVLGGVRGGPPVHLDAVVDAIVRIAELADALGPDLESLEVNPLRIDGAVVQALDAVVTWRQPEHDREERA